jgi:hypothetical protein
MPKMNAISDARHFLSLSMPTKSERGGIFVGLDPAGNGMSQSVITSTPRAFESDEPTGYMYDRPHTTTQDKINTQLHNRESACPRRDFSKTPAIAWKPPPEKKGWRKKKW